MTVTPGDEVPEGDAAGGADRGRRRPLRRRDAAPPGGTDPGLGPGPAPGRAPAPDPHTGELPAFDRRADDPRGGDTGRRRGDAPGHDTGQFPRYVPPADSPRGGGYSPYGQEGPRDAYGDPWRREPAGGGGWTPYGDSRVGLPQPGPPPGYPPGYGEPDPRTSTGDVRLPAPPPQPAPGPPRQQAWRGLALLMTGLAVALAIAVVFVVVRGGSDVAAPEADRAVGLPEVPVPDLRGRDVADATNALQSIGLEIVVASPTPDPSAPPDTILDSNPPADALAAPGTLVRVFVSGGPPAEPVPGVGGLERAEAERILREAGFTLAPPREEESNDVAQGLVIRSDPAEGDEASAGTPVQLVVSSGPPPFTLARLIGLSEPDAIRQIEAAGLRPDVLRRFSTAPVGQVIDQTPDGGVEVRGGDTVTITISLGQ